MAKVDDINATSSEEYQLTNLDGPAWYLSSAIRGAVAARLNHDLHEFA
jgi:hypothetical protein